MAHHKSAKKRIRQDEKEEIAQPLLQKSARTAIQKLREMTEKSDAESFLPKVIAMIDKLAKKGAWHDNKASNLKGKLMKHINSL